MAVRLSQLDLDALNDVVENSELISVDHHEISATRSEGTSDEEHELTLAIDVQERHGDFAYGVRLNASVYSPLGTASAAVAVEYSLLNGITPDRRTLHIFASEVAIMTVFPYLREAIATVTHKVFGSPVQLPIIKRGEIAFEFDAR